MNREQPDKAVLGVYRAVALASLMIDNADGLHVVGSRRRDRSRDSAWGQSTQSPFLHALSP